MKVIYSIKKIFIGIAVILIMTSGVLVRADEEVQSGIYTVKNSVYHENETGMAMARNYVSEDMQVKITKEGTVFTIGFSGTNYMNNYRIKINDAEVPVEIVEENTAENTIKLQVSAPSKDVKIAACIYVDPMGRDVEFQIIPDYSSLVLVEAIEEAPVKEADISTEETSDETQEVSNEEEVSVSEKYIHNKVIIAGVAVFAVVAVSAIVIVKKRKH